MKPTLPHLPALSPLTGTLPSGAVSVPAADGRRRGPVPHASGEGHVGVTGHESVFHAVGDVPKGEPAQEREPGVGLHARACPDTPGCARPSSAHGAAGCREASAGVTDIADRGGAFGAPPEAEPMRDCSPADVRTPLAVRPFVPPDMTGGPTEPVSSQAEDLGARGGQARPLLLPASRNLVAARDKAEERTLRAVLECLM